jgi:hypothetical protein
MSPVWGAGFRAAHGLTGQRPVLATEEPGWLSFDDKNRPQQVGTTVFRGLCY